MIEIRSKYGINDSSPNKTTKIYMNIKNQIKKENLKKQKNSKNKKKTSKLTFDEKVDLLLKHKIIKNKKLPPDIIDELFEILI